MWKIGILVCLLALSSTLTGCNMIHGAGEDVEKVGDEIKDATN